MVRQKARQGYPAGRRQPIQGNHKMIEFLPLEKFSALDSWAPVTPAWSAYYPQAVERQEATADRAASTAKGKR
jgi:hypothetical protein